MSRVQPYEPITSGRSPSCIPPFLTGNAVESVCSQNTADTRGVIVDAGVFSRVLDHSRQVAIVRSPNRLEQSILKPGVLACKRQCCSQEGMNSVPRELRPAEEGWNPVVAGTINRPEP